MKIPEEMKKKVVLTKSEPRIGYQSGQKGEVHPIAKMTAERVIRIDARTHRLRSDKFDSIFQFTVSVGFDSVCVSRFFALTVSLSGVFSVLLQQEKFYDFYNG